MENPKWRIIALRETKVFQEYHDDIKQKTFTKQV